MTKFVPCILTCDPKQSKMAAHALKIKFSQSFCQKLLKYSSPSRLCSTVPLCTPLPGIPPITYASTTDQNPKTKVTVLENGLRVASENRFGNFSTVGVLLDSGSRYEVSYPSGISHFLEKLAFNSTSKFDNRDVILQSLEKHGGICDCQGSRDCLIYAISAETTGLSHIIDILSQVILQPQLTNDEIEDARAAMMFEIEGLNMRPDPELLMMEMIHAAAYRDNTLGLPKICPSENVDVIDKSILHKYLSNYHTPKRMVLAGVGMDHDVLVEAAKQHFSVTPTWPSCTPIQDMSISQYTGGVVHTEKDLSEVSLGPTPMPELAHIVIGLESCSHKDPDFIAFCVLNMLLGGGGSFSAGGPGKGMYTRLYLNVLNQHHWIHQAMAFNHAYDDSGLFCIHASSHPSQLKDLVEIIIQEYVNTMGGAQVDELSRAKRQLQSMLMMNLESRPVMFEDIGRQVLANDHRKPPKYYFDEIEKITSDDVVRVASRMLSCKPSVAALGSLKHMPRYEDIQAAMASRDGKIPKQRFSLFR